MAQSRLPRSISQVLLALLVVMVIAPDMRAQQNSIVRRDQAAQAKSEEELDAYLEVVLAEDPRELLQQVKLFLERFPQSELLVKVYEHQLYALQDLNDFAGAVTVGEKIIRIDPGNVSTLLAVATMMVNQSPGGVGRAGILARSEDYAHRVLEGMETAQAPHTMTLEEWDTEKHDRQRRAHKVLGAVAEEQGRLPAAIREFQTAISLAHPPEGADFLRLGVALQSTGATREAEEALRRAVELGPDPVRRLALKDLRKLASNKEVPDNLKEPP